jgi:hypothetical protein
MMTFFINETYLKCLCWWHLRGAMSFCQLTVLHLKLQISLTMYNVFFCLKHLNSSTSCTRADNDICRWAVEFMPPWVPFSISLLLGLAVFPTKVFKQKFGVVGSSRPFGLKFVYTCDLEVRFTIFLQLKMH